MKYTLLLILIFSGAIKLLSQDTTFVYYDNVWKETTKEKAVYFRKLFKLDDKFIVYDYYANDTLRMTGAYTSAKADVKMGKFTYYYDNGVKSKEGTYVSNKQNDTWEYFNRNGKLGSEVVFLMDSVVSYVYWNEAGNRMTDSLALEIMPEFNGGEDSLLNYLKYNTHYPDVAIAMDIQGKVLVWFVIGLDGSIEDAKVSRSVHPIIDAEALRVIQIMPKWIPGRQYNIPVKVIYTIPILFHL